MEQIPDTVWFEVVENAGEQTPEKQEAVSKIGLAVIYFDPSVLARLVLASLPSKETDFHLFQSLMVED